MRILVAEDDDMIGESLVAFLESEDYAVDWVRDGQSALLAMKTTPFSLVILDLGLPGKDGLQVLKEVRARRDPTPVLVTTARDTVDDRVKGLDSGADDYLVKPINVNELVLRIQALLRRAQMVADRRQSIGSTVFEFDSFTVRTGSSQLVLPQKEFLLLYKLVSSPGHIFTRQQLMDDIWGVDSQTDPRTVDVHINRLRDHFRENPDFEITTVRGIGYKAVKK